MVFVLLKFKIGMFLINMDVCYYIFLLYIFPNDLLLAIYFILWIMLSSLILYNKNLDWIVACNEK